MSLEALQAYLDAHGESKEGMVAGLVMCFGPWGFVALVVTFMIVGTILTVLFSRGRRARQREDAVLSEEELERKTREMQKRWDRRLFGR
jgi:membrane protein implicated in regulation of membrane protease activity